MNAGRNSRSARNQIEQLGGRAAFGDHQHGIAGLADSQVAVSRFGGMQKDRGGAGALERRGDLAGDVAGFAEAGDDQLAGMAENQLDGGDQSCDPDARTPPGSPAPLFP